GFLYMTDSWGVVYKIDVRSGTAGTILWKMDPELANQDRNRGVALWGDLVISLTGYAGRVIATDKDTGKIIWDKNLLDQADLDRLNGQFLKATQTVKDVTWTKGIDPKTGRPIDYDPNRDVQVYAEGAGSVLDKNVHRICPSATGGTNFWPSSYSRKTGNLYIL